MRGLEGAAVRAGRGRRGGGAGGGLGGSGGAGGGGRRGTPGRKSQAWDRDVGLPLGDFSPRSAARPVS